MLYPVSIFSKGALGHNVTRCPSNSHNKWVALGWDSRSKKWFIILRFKGIPDPKNGSRSWWWRLRNSKVLTFGGLCSHPSRDVFGAKRSGKAGRRQAVSDDYMTIVAQLEFFWASKFFEEHPANCRVIFFVSLEVSNHNSFWKLQILLSCPWILHHRFEVKAIEYTRKVDDGVACHRNNCLFTWPQLSQSLWGPILLLAVEGETDLLTVKNFGLPMKVFASSLGWVWYHADWAIACWEDALVFLFGAERLQGWKGSKKFQCVGTVRPL